MSSKSDKPHVHHFEGVGRRCKCGQGLFESSPVDPTVGVGPVMRLVTSEADLGERFAALLQRLKPEVQSLTPQDLRWARLFYNQGFIEGTVAARTQVAARIQEFKAREEGK